MAHIRLSPNAKCVQETLKIHLDTEISSGKNDCLGDSAVYIQNLWKRYEDGPSIIQNVCMNIKTGTIYGLLGASGCGKTTILSCIVGLQKCDRGEILVFGAEPGTSGSGIPGKGLGYMPQELALYSFLTAREIIQFYGRVYGMTNTEIEEQWKYLVTLLKLPSNFTLTANLSGGQQRRVSLALALIHSPQLLILDEPTVGLDPLLRKDIWDYLHKLVDDQRTAIIITTHYIEEARNANMVGVMRDGRMLVQDSPWNLLQDNGCELLEHVVLELCRRDKKNIDSVKPNGSNDSTKYFHTSRNGESDLTLVKSIEENSTINCQYVRTGGFDNELSHKVDRTGVTMTSSTNHQIHELFHFFKRIYGFTIVTLLTFMRNPIFIAVTLCVPCIQGTLSLLCFGTKPSGIHLGIVNNELANWTIECDSTGPSYNSCDFSALSCRYLNELKSDDLVILNPYENEAEAMNQAMRGSVVGFISLPDNYSQHTLDFMVAQRFAQNESIIGSRIHVHLDYSNKIQVLFLTKYLLSTFLKYIKDLAASCHVSGHEAELPIHFRKPLYDNEDKYTSAVIPSVILGSFAVVGYVLTGVVLVSDRKHGTLSRAHVAGLPPRDVLTSHMITQGIIAAGQIIFWHVLLYFVFSFQSAGSPVIMIIFCLLSQLYGSAVGILAAQIFDEEMYVLTTAILLASCFLFLGCVAFPMEFMLPFFRYVSYAVPLTVPSFALESVTVRGMGFIHPLVLSGLGVLICWIVISLFGSALLYKKVNK